MKVTEALLPKPFTPVTIVFEVWHEAQFITTALRGAGPGLTDEANAVRKELITRLQLLGF